MQATSVPTVAHLTSQITSAPAAITTQPLISSGVVGEGISPLGATPSMLPSKVAPLSGTTLGSLGALPPLTSTLPSMATSGPTVLPSVGMGIDPASLVNPTVVAPPVGTVAPLTSTMVPTLQSAGVTPLVTASALPSSTASAPTAPISIPSATSTPRASIGSLDRSQSIESQPEWSIPHQTKLKYTQLFNSTDRQRSGYLSGAQARNIMVQTKLPQNVLAEIWALSDMDADGRLGCEEFVLALHLCEKAQAGTPPPARLPPDLIPPAFRRAARTSSISSQGSAGTGAEQDPAATLLQQNSFEDKRKENFEKGQAELERRRRALYDQQRQEREERERKEREEQERKEKARQEAERKRLEELEKHMREQQEKERMLEEERKRQAEQRETARREMERQRQLEWEKQRLQELQQQRQREQENVLKLKAKNQTLTIELTSLNEQIKQLSQKICDTRIGVTNAKSTIDGMRGTRDGYMSEMSQLKNKLKEQNAKLLALSQEKVKLEAKLKMNAQHSEQAKQAFENKEINIKNLKQKIDDLQEEIDTKMADIENNNTQLTDLQNQIRNLVNDCEQLYTTYETKRDIVLEMKSASRNDYNSWKSNDAWGDSAEAKSEWPVDNWSAPKSATISDTTIIPGILRYRALYEFVARNSDEISFQPGDTINVPKEQTGEPGWLAGEIRGKTGWFPESYVEPIEGVGVRDTDGSGSQLIPSYAPEETTTESTRVLEGIAEVPESTETFNVTEPASTSAVSAPISSEPENFSVDTEPEYYIANYPYQSQEVGDLTFNAGEVIAVIKKEGEWWTGKLGDNVGIFPSNYVQKVDTSSNAAKSTHNVSEFASTVNVETASSQGVSAEAVRTALEDATTQQSQADNEVSQLTQSSKKSIDETGSLSGGQVVKTKKPEIASVIAPYQSTSPEQLSLARGQLIMIRKKTESGWWEGELQAKGRKRQVGWFPASYVKVLNSSGKMSGRTTPVSTTRMQQEIIIDKVIALFPYTAANPDELTFSKDDIISVTARDEEAWWKGELNGVSGLFPSNYVTPLQATQLSCRRAISSEENRKRRESIREFIKTEKTYVKDLEIVHEVFELPLRKSKIISKEDIDSIFLNWQEIIHCNKTFLEAFLKAYNTSEIIGDVISEHVPKMTAYVTFCGKQLESAALLQKLTETSVAFKELMKRCQSNHLTKGMPLSSFLIKPMQRITRYPLMISNILVNTDKEHSDYQHLQKSLSLAETFLSKINENVRLRQTEKQMNWLQDSIQNELNLVFNSKTNKMGPRKLLHFGVLKKLKSGKELICFLFNDFLMLTQCSRNVSHGQFMFEKNSNVIYKMYKQPILTQNLSMIVESQDNLESGTDSNRVLTIQDTKSKYKISLVASTVHECSLWSKTINAAKEDYAKMLTLSQKNRWKTLPNIRSCQLVVDVVKGLEIQKICNAQTCQCKGTKGKPHTENIYVKTSLGNQEQETQPAKEIITNTGDNIASQTPAFYWNHSMQFQIRNVNKEKLHFTVLEQNPYQPDEFLGRAEIDLKEIQEEATNKNGPMVKRLILHQVESGEIVVKLDLHLFKDY
nr:unnamed protein product [Callosobruchus chinensis]